MITEFLHTVIDLCMRQIVAPDGQPVTLCQIDANAPILLWCEEPSEGDGESYSMGKALGTNDTLRLDINPFELLVKRCADCIVFCVIAPNDVEESIYHIQCIEQGKVVSEDIPDGAIGKVSKGSRFEFDMKVCRPTQAFRIETIPSEDIILGKSKIIYLLVDEQEQEGENQ